MRINIKPLSVNQCWQGVRYKTPAYKTYEKELLLKLPRMKLPDPPYRVSYEFGVSNSMADIDNAIKPSQDILCKKYGFDDRDIYAMEVRKVKVEKGQEYFEFEIGTIEKK